MTNQRHPRREEGQVYPALLLAVVGGLAIAVAFVGLQNLLDQNGRATSASDSAALAVGKAQEEAIVNVITVGLGNGLDLGALLTELRSGTLGMDTADSAASNYAGANGATVQDVQLVSFDPTAMRWVFKVRTQQKDVVKGGNTSAQTVTSSKVSSQIIGGLCPGFSGIAVGGMCESPTEWLKDCVAPKPSPTPPAPTDKPSSKPSDKPSDKPSSAPPTPTFTPKPFCGVDLANLLRWDIRLIN